MKLRYLVRMVMSQSSYISMEPRGWETIINMQSLKQSYQVVTIIIPILLVRN